MDPQPRQRPVVRRSAAFAALALVAALCASPAAHAATPDGGGGFAARPAGSSPHDKAQTYFKLKASRGEVLHETVVVSNLSKNTKHFLLDQVDGLTGQTSGAVYANRDDPRTGAGNWLTPSRTTLIIKPHTQVQVPFTVRVPKDARAGDRLAGLAIQDAHREHADSRFAITQIIRVVVGVEITVKGNHNAALSLGKLQMAALPGTKVPSVIVQIDNTGKRVCKPLLHVSVASDKTQAQIVTRRLDTILPGTSINYPLPWPTALNAGKYDVRARATHCGPVVSTQASATLGSTLLGTPKQPDPPKPTVVVKASPVPVWAMIGGAGLAALVGGALVGVLLTRRRRDDDDIDVATA